jgi:predicted nucleotidyltransferase
MAPAKLSLKSLTRRLVRRLEEHGIVAEALYLFGSRARGEGTPDSDIDVLVVSSGFARQGFWARCGRVGEALGDMPEPVQIYPVTRTELRRPEPGGFLASIQSDLQLLYDCSAVRKVRMSS